MGGEDGEGDPPPINYKYWLIKTVLKGLLNYDQYFLAQEQETLKRKLEEAEAARQAQPPAKKQRCCRKCKNPMLGHPHGHCVNQAEEN